MRMTDSTCDQHDLRYSLYGAALVTALFKRYYSVGDSMNAAVLDDIVNQFSFYDSFLITCLEVATISNYPSEHWTIEEFNFQLTDESVKKHLLNIWARYQQILGRDLPEGVSDEDFGPHINGYFQEWFIQCFMLWHENGAA